MLYVAASYPHTYKGDLGIYSENCVEDCIQFAWRTRRLCQLYFVEENCHHRPHGVDNATFSGMYL